MSDYLGADIAPLGFGGMFGFCKTIDQMDMGEVCRMVDRFMEAGFSCFDCAFAYDATEAALGAALVARYPRESFQLTQKITAWKMRSPEDMQRNLDASLATTNAGYFDFLMVHNVSVQGGRMQLYEDWGTWEFMAEQKRKGIARHIGFSFHDKPEILEKVLTEHPETEFVLLQIDYYDWENPLVESRRCYEVARAHDIPVMVMKPLRGGLLTHLPQKADELVSKAKADPATLALRFCTSLEGVIAVFSTMNTFEQVDANVRAISCSATLTDDETRLIGEITQAIYGLGLIDCSNCRYCVEVCPRHIRIPWIINIMNDTAISGDIAGSKGAYAWETAWGGKASECIRCGKCRQQCTMHLDVPALMEQAIWMFEAKTADGGSSPVDADDPGQEG